MAEVKTQKTTKVSESERFAAVPELKRQIRMTDPNLSAREVEKRALTAVGLNPGLDDVDLNTVPKGGRPRAAARATGKAIGTTVEGGGRAVRGVGRVITTNHAQKVIFGIMVGVTALTIMGEMLSGTSRNFDVIPRRMVAGTIAGIMFMLLAIPVPKLAMTLAVVTGLSALLLNPSNAAVISKIVAAGSGSSQAAIPKGSGTIGGKVQ